MNHNSAVAGFLWQEFPPEVCRPENGKSYLFAFLGNTQCIDMTGIIIYFLSNFNKILN